MFCKNVYPTKESQIKREKTIKKHSSVAETRSQTRTSTEILWLRLRMHAIVVCNRTYLHHATNERRKESRVTIDRATQVHRTS